MNLAVDSDPLGIMDNRELVAYLSGDECWDASFSGVLFSQIKSESLDYVLSQTFLVDTCGTALTSLSAGSITLKTSSDIHLKMPRGDLMVGHSVIFKRDIIRRVSVFDESVICCSDGEFFLRMTKSCCGAHILQELAFDRIHERNFVLNQLESLDSLAELKDILWHY